MHRLIHAAKDKPNFGIIQPALGADAKISSRLMGRTPKIPKPKSIMRGVIAANVRALMDLKYRDIEKKTNRVKKLAEEANIGHGSIQRILDGEVGASIDLIENLALALDVSVYQLVLPNLDTSNPQVVNGATRNERMLYARMNRAAAGLPQETHQVHEPAIKRFATRKK